MSKREPTSLHALPDLGRNGPPEVDKSAPEPIDPAHRDAVAAGLADMRAGRIASKEEIDAVYARFGRRTR